MRALSRASHSRVELRAMYLRINLLTNTSFQNLAVIVFLTKKRPLHSRNQKTSLQLRMEPASPLKTMKEDIWILRKLRSFRKKNLAYEDAVTDHVHHSPSQHWTKMHQKYRSDAIYHRIFSKSQRSRKPVIVEGAFTGDPEIIDNLIERQCEVDTADEDGNTALHVAIRMGFWDVANRLLDAHADVTTHNKEGVAAIHLAALFNQLDLVLRMLKAGANVNAADNTLTTCLMIAARTGALGLVYILLDYGAEVLLIDAKRRTAVDIARLEGYQPIVDVLLRYQPKRKVTIIPIVTTLVFREVMKNLGIEHKPVGYSEQDFEWCEGKSPTKISESHEKEAEEEGVSDPEFLSCNLDDNGEELKGFCGKVKSDIKKLYEEIDYYQRKEAPRMAKHQRLGKGKGKNRAERNKLNEEKRPQSDDEDFVSINLYDADDRATVFCEKVKTDLKRLWTQVDHFEKEIARHNLANRPSTTVILHDKAVKGEDLVARIEDIRNVVQKFKIEVIVEDQGELKKT